MRLPALALFERALRVETRSALMFAARTGLLAMILLVLLPVQAMARVGAFGAPGLTFLQEMVWVNLVFISLAGMSYFASAITEEKEEMMLGLLRMTDLDPVAILLGKSTSRLIGAILLLLAQIPFVLLAVTLGGVGALQIAAAYATLLAYLFLLCNLALLFSVMFRNTAIAGAATLSVLLLFFFGCYWASAIEQSVASSHNVDLARGGWPILTGLIGYWEQATPSARLRTVFQTGFTGPVIGFQATSNLVLGVLLFFLAWAVFDRFTREEKDAAPARLGLFGRTRRRSRMPPGLVGAPAITWKDYTFLSGGGFGLLIKFLILGLLVGICFAVALWSDTVIDREFVGQVFIWVSLMSTALWLALDASRMFNQEVRWKTLSSLMTLPISARELAYRKVAGALRGTLPLLAVFLVGLMLVPKTVGEFFDVLHREPEVFSFIVLTVLQFILFLHLTAFLSLLLKRGALALAFAIQYLGGSFLMGFASAFLLGRGGEEVWLVTGFFCFGLTVLLHVAIGYRLVRVAAEE